jgi:uncharacterized membrane protein SpoIIM required for sporulation
MTAPTATPTTAGAGPDPSGTRDLRRSVVSATVTALLLSCVGVAVGYGSFVPDGGAATDDPFTLDSTGLALFAEIASRNVGAALLLFSGVATVGATTVLGLVFVAAWVGAGFHAVHDETGLLNVDPLVLAYLPLEFVGLLVAGVAGLLPLVALVSRFLAAEPSRRSGPALIGTALRLLAAGVVLILGGAAVETLVIHQQS